MSKPTPETDVLVKIIDLLKPLKPEERQRVINSAFLFLGEQPIKESGGSDSSHGKSTAAENDNDGLPARAKSWMKQNGVTAEQLEEIFHFDGNTAEVIDVPGKSNKEKTLNAYILTGVSNLFSTGTANFNDESARALCQAMGCYDKNNHSSYIKGKGNVITGTKNGGWSLTAPGLKQAAGLVKKKTAS
jgi:hypothetical protein